MSRDQVPNTADIDEVRKEAAADTLACQAATGVGHQIASTFDENLVHLAVGTNDPNEVSTGRVR